MKLLDWLFFIYYQITLDRGSRLERANFLLWYSSSFVLVGFFYLVLTIFTVQIEKYLFLPVFITVFAVNYFILKNLYIKSNRAQTIVEKRTVGVGYKIFAWCFVLFSVFGSMALMLAMAIYYGKNIGFR